MDVAHRLRTARRTARLSQAALGRRVGVDRVTVARYESGAVTPAADTYLRLIAACDATAAPLGPEDLALLDAQLARRPEDRLHASQELARLRAAARG